MQEFPRREGSRGNSPFGRCVDAGAGDAAPSERTLRVKLPQGRAGALIPWAGQEGTRAEGISQPWPAGDSQSLYLMCPVSAGAPAGAIRCP